MNKRLVMILILLISVQQMMAQTGYRDLFWGTSKAATKKTVSSWYGDPVNEMENALIYKAAFQGETALFKFLFEKDSLYMVGISVELPYNLGSEGQFKRNFKLSEEFVDGLLERLYAKYSDPLLDEKQGIDQFVHWQNGETEIEALIKRNATYTVVVTYGWGDFFKRKAETRESGYQEEL